MRLFSIVFISLLFLGAGLPESVTARDIQRAYKITQRGERALRAGNIEKARDHFDDALRYAPMFSMAHVGMGHVSMQERRFDEALESYRKALVGYQAMGEALLEIDADRYHESRVTLARKQSEILNLQNTLSRLNPQQLQMVRGRVLAIEGEIREIESMPMPTPEKAHEPPARIHFFIGNALINLDRTSEAIQAYETCCHKNPGFALAHHNLAVGFWKVGRPAAALSHLARAEELGLPVNPELKARVRALRP